MPRRPPLTKQEQQVYRDWAQRNLVEPFLEAMEEWNQGAAPGRRPPSVSPQAPLPCHPRLTGSDICVSPYPPGPPGPRTGVQRIPRSRWPKAGLKLPRLGR